MEATSDTVAQAEATVALAAETLRGDIRDKILDDIARDMPCWTKLSEREQKKFIGRADSIAYLVVREATKLVAHQGFAPPDRLHGQVEREGRDQAGGQRLLFRRRHHQARLARIRKRRPRPSRGFGLLRPASRRARRQGPARDEPRRRWSEDDEEGERESEADDEGAEAVEADRSPLPEPPTTKTRSRRAPADADA